MKLSQKAVIFDLKGGHTSALFPAIVKWLSIIQTRQSLQPYYNQIIATLLVEQNRLLHAAHIINNMIHPSLILGMERYLHRWMIF